MYLSETLARDRNIELRAKAQQATLARQAAELRKLARIQQRTERKLLRAWRRSDELRTMIGAAG